MQTNSFFVLFLSTLVVGACGGVDAGSTSENLGSDIVKNDRQQTAVYVEVHSPGTEADFSRTFVVAPSTSSSLQALPLYNAPRVREQVGELESLAPTGECLLKPGLMVRYDDLSHTVESARRYQTRGDLSAVDALGPMTSINWSDQYLSDTERATIANGSTIQVIANRLVAVRDNTGSHGLYVLASDVDTSSFEAIDDPIADLGTDFIHVDCGSGREGWINVTQALKDQVLTETCGECDTDTPEGAN